MKKCAYKVLKKKETDWKFLFCIGDCASFEIPFFIGLADGTLSGRNIRKVLFTLVSAKMADQILVILLTIFPFKMKKVRLKKFVKDTFTAMAKRIRTE